MVAGLMLRIMDANRFRVVYTFDDWATQTTMVESRTVGYPGSYVDISTTPEQNSGKIIFHLILASRKIAGWAATTR